MRVARDLHDTLLQTIEGSKIVVELALRAIDDPAAMRRTLEQVSAWLDRAAAESRTVLHSLRTSPSEGDDLVAALQRVTELVAVPRAMAVRWSVAGTPRELHPIVRDEVYRIGSEAIANAARHSGARGLRIEVEYTQDLIVRVIDDGRGIDADIAQHGRPGHLGLQGMRERAAAIAATLDIACAANAGTTVALAVPGGLAFLRPRVLRAARTRARSSKGPRSGRT
jgi:signal transduction histidine kinase